MTDNQLSGSIPTELGSLTSLTELDLSVNDLSGSIPSQLGSLTSVAVLNLSYNGLTGAIPGGLGSMAALEELWLNDNSLSGYIPTGLGSLVGVVEVYLDNNDLTGSIPAEVGDMASLEVLYLSNNKLTGSIPSDLGDLSQLSELELSNNNLQGSIPSQIGDLSEEASGSLYLLGICENQLTGAVPSDLRSADLLTGYPTADGYDPIACQNAPSNIVYTPPDPNLQITVSQTSTIDVGSYATDGDYTISCGTITESDPDITLGTQTGCSIQITAGATPNQTADISIPYRSSGGYTLTATLTIDVVAASNIVFTAPTGLKVGTNRTQTIDALDYATDGGYTITCGTATNTAANVPTSGTVALASVTRDTSGNGCGYTITPTATQGAATFTIPYTSAGGDTANGNISITVGPASTIVYTSPGTLRVGRNQTLEIDASGYVSDNSAYTITCADATGVVATRMAVTRTANSCTFTIDPVDALTPANQGVTTFSVVFTSDGGHSITRTISVNIGPDSALTFTDPGTFTLGRNRTLVIDALAAISGENAAYTVTCADATGVDANKMTVTRSSSGDGCSFTVDPVDSLVQASQGDTTFSVAYTSTGGATATGTYTINIGPDSTITYTAPTGLQIGRNLTLAIDASDYVEETTGSSYTISCSDARNLTGGRLASVTRTANTCDYTITPNTSASTGNASFTITYTSTGGHSIVRVISLRVGPDSAITLNLPPTSGAGSLLTGRNQALVVDAGSYASETSGSGYTITCGDATSIDSTRLTSVTHTGSSCSFTVTPVSSLSSTLQATNATFTVPYTSTGGATANGIISVKIGPDSTMTFTAPTGLKVGRNRTLEIDAAAAISGEDSGYTITCGDATGVDASKMTVSHTGSSCTFTVDPVNNLASGSQGDTTFSVAFTSTGGATASGTFTVNIGPDSTITYTPPTGLTVGRNRTLVIDASSYVSEADSNNTITCGDATSIDSTKLTSVTRTANTCSFVITPVSSLAQSLQGETTFSITFTSTGGHEITRTITVDVGPDSTITFTPPASNLAIAASRTRTIDVSSYAADGSYTITCGAITESSALISLGSQSGCSIPVTSAGTTGTATISIPYASSGGHTLTSSLSIDVGAASSIVFNAPTGLKVGTNRTQTINALDYASDGGYTITCGTATNTAANVPTSGTVALASVTRDTSGNGCSYTITPTATQGTATFTIPYTSAGGDTANGNISITVGPPSTISYSSPGTLRVGRNQTLEIDASGYVTDNSAYTITCADATGVVATRMAVTRTANSCTFTIDPVDALTPANQGVTTFSVVFTSDGGHSITRTISVNIGPDSTVTFTDPGTFTLGRNRTLVIDALAAISGENAAYTVTCADATGVDANKMTVTRSSSGDGCSFTVDPVDTLAVGSQGDTTFSVAYTSTGGATASGTYTVNIGPDSTITYNAPTGLQIGRNLTLTIDASDYVSEAGSSYTISCSDARNLTGGRLTSVARTANTCSYTIDPNNSASTGNASFTITYTSTGGHSIDRVISLRVGPNSVITFNAPPTTGAGRLLTGRNQALVVDAGSYASETSGSGYTISCGDATSIDTTRLASVTHTGSSCTFAVTPISTLSSVLQTTAATFTVPYTSTGGATATGTISVKIGPDSSIVFTAPAASALPVVAGGSAATVNAASYATDGSYTISCGDATAVSASISLVRTGCSFAVTAQASASGIVSFTVPYTSSGGSSASGTIEMAVSKIVFAAPVGLSVPAGGVLVIDASDYASDGDFTISCGTASGVSAGISVQPTGCSFEVTAQASASGAASFTVPYTSTGGATASGVIGVFVGATQTRNIADCGGFVDTSANPTVPGANNDLVDDCEALLALHENWRNTADNNNLSSSHFIRTWGAGSASQRLVQNWDGVTVSGGRVTALNLSGLEGDGDGVSGSIATEIGDLTALTVLDLSYNSLTGAIPTQIGSLTSLTILDLTDNQLSGSIPTQIGSLTSLTELDLSVNRLSGSIPSQLGSLTSVAVLNLSYNGLTGAIPGGLGSMAALEELYLNHNSLSDSIPTELGSLVGVVEVYLDNNDLTGSIPTEIGDMANLEVLYLSNNKLTGSIPSDLGDLSELSELELSNNRLTGAIPSQIGDLSAFSSGNLYSLGICGNKLTGAVPTALRGVSDAYPLGLLVGYKVADGYDPIACQTNIVVPAIPEFTVGRNRTLVIDALDFDGDGTDEVTDGSHTINCGDATGVDSDKMTVTRSTRTENYDPSNPAHDDGCSFTVDPVDSLTIPSPPAEQRVSATFSVLFTSTGGDTETGTFTVNIGPDSTISYTDPGTLRVGRNRTLEIDALAAISGENAAYTVTCGDATGVDATKMTVTRSSSGDGCSFTVAPIGHSETDAADRLAPALQGETTFSVAFTSTGGATASGTFTVNIGTDSALTFTAPSTFTLGRNRTLVIDALAAISGENAAYTVTCGDATGVDASKMTVTRSSSGDGCSFTVDPVDSLVQASQGDTTFSVAYTSTGGATASGTYTINIGPDSTITYTAPTGLQIGRNLTLAIDASDYVEETTGSSYTISCSDARNLTGGRLASVTRTANTCDYTITPNTSASTGNASFTITYTSTGGHSIVRVISLRVGPDSAITLNLPPTSGAGRLLTGRNRALVVDAGSYASETSGSGYTITCGDATSIDSTRLASVTHTGSSCTFTVTPISTLSSTLQTANATFTVPYTSSGGATANGIISVKVGPDSTMTFTAPTGLKVGRNRTLEIDAAAAISGEDSTYAISCGDATGVDASKITVSHTGSSCSFTVDPVDSLASGSQGDTTFSVAFTSTGGASASGTFTVNIGPDSTITYSTPGTLTVGRNRTLTIDASGYVSEADSNNTITCGNAAGIDSSRLTSVTRTANTCSFTITPITTLTPAQQGNATFSITFTSDGGHEITRTITVNVGPDSTIVFTPPASNLAIAASRTRTIDVSSYAADGSYTITCGAITESSALISLGSQTGCSIPVTSAGTTGTATISIPYASSGGHTLTSSLSIDVGAASSIVFNAPTGLKVGTNRTQTIDALDYASDGGYTITCGTATNTAANVPTSGTVALASVVRDTSGNGCSYTITPTATQGTATFTIPYTSAGGDTANGNISITVGPPSTISYSSPGTLRIGRNQTLEIDASGYVSDNAAYTITCADATGVVATRMSVTRTANSCTFTIDPVDALAPANQGVTTFTIPFTSDGGHSITRTISVNIGPDSALTFTDPGTFTLGRNRTLVIDALAAISGENAAYTVTCGDATGVDATKMTVTRSSSGDGCSFTVDPVDSLVQASQGDTTFSVAYTSTGGATASGTYTINIGPDSTITYTAPTGLQIGRNLTLAIDASDYVEETTGSSYTISCSDARNLTGGRLTSVARTANTCSYTIDPNNSASTGNASFTITYTSTGGHSIVRVISLRVGPNSAITLNLPPTSGAGRLLTGRNQALVVDAGSYASETSGSGYTISCGDATSIDSTRLTSVTHTGSSCSFTVTPVSSLSSTLQATNATFTVPYVSSGGATANGIISVKIGPDSTMTFTAPTGLKVGRNRTLEIDAAAAISGEDSAYAISCGDATGVDASKMTVSHTGSSCTFTVDPVNNLAAGSQGDTTFSVAFASSGGATASGTFTVNIGPDSNIGLLIFPLLAVRCSSLPM